MAFISYEKKDKVVTVTINRPDRGNALGKEVVAELKDIWKRFENDPEAMVAILTGSGRAFSAGADVKDMVQGQAPIETESQRTYEVIQKLTKPVIAAVNGFALGSGLWELVLQCDIRIAAASATFGMPEIAIAIPATVRHFITQGIPRCMAMELVLTGNPITAQRAYEVGLVNKVVPDDELMSTAMKIAERIAALPPRAVSLVRQDGVEALEMSEKQLSLKQKVEEIAAESRMWEDRKEAVRAFIEKRKPVFKGK